MEVPRRKSQVTDQKLSFWLGKIVTGKTFHYYNRVFKKENTLSFLLTDKLCFAHSDDTIYIMA